MSVYAELRFAPIPIGDLFILHRGKQGTPVATGEGGRTPYIAAASRNNSQVGWVKEDALFPGGWLAIVNTGAGGVGYCTFQPVPFWASNNVTALEPKESDAPVKALMVMASIIRLQCFGLYTYGAIANNRRVTKQRIMVPVTESEAGNDVVDWDGMDRLGEELMIGTLNAARAVHLDVEKAPPAPPILSFEPMLITDVFESMKASTAWYDKSALNTVGNATYPFVSRTKADNGVDGFCPRQAKSPEKGGAITIGLDTQTVGYQPVPFYTSQNIQVLRHSRLTPKIAATLMAVIKAQLRKFSWGGNGATLGRLKACKIMVPATRDDAGNVVVDWDAIEHYGDWLAAKVDQQLTSALRAALCASATPA